MPVFDDINTQVYSANAKRRLVTGRDGKMLLLAFSPISTVNSHSAFFLLCIFSKQCDLFYSAFKCP